MKLMSHRRFRGCMSIRRTHRLMHPIVSQAGMITIAAEYSNSRMSMNWHGRLSIWISVK